MARLTPSVVHVGNFYQTQGNASAFTISSPTVEQFALRAGDLIVIGVRWQTAGAPNPPQSSDFTLIGPVHTTNTTHRVLGLLAKGLRLAGDATAEQGAVHTVSLPGISSQRVLGQLVVVRDADLDDMVAGSSAYLGTGITNGIAMESFDLSGEGPWLALAVGGAEFSVEKSAAVTSSPAGWSTIKVGVTDGGIGTSRTAMAMYARQYNATPTGRADLVWGSGPTAANLIGAALRGPSTHGPGFTVADGDGGTAKLYVINEAGVAVTPVDVIPAWRGFDSVDEMIATPGYTMGHRGNSTRYPEMSMHAYTQTAYRGYGVMELSLARTSDGVFFGLHDDTLQRTSPTAPATAASGLTWAQVRSHLNTTGEHGGPAPYLLLDDYIATFGASHVTFFDPKAMSSIDRLALYTKLAAEVGTDRAVIKSYGATPGLATQAKSHGFLTWGYFYATNLDGTSFTRYQADWDLLGMECRAALSYWETTLATAAGRPVIGHVAATQADYDAAMSKGAAGVQVAASHLVRPVSWWTP